VTDLLGALAPDQPTGLGTAMAGGKGKLNLDKTARRDADYYPTPFDATRAFLLAEGEHIRRHALPVWECCGRGGAIAAVLAQFDFDVIATDIVEDPANAVAQLDVLRALKLLGVPLTNPPFALAGRILDVLLGRLKAPYVALLLKSTFFSTDTDTRGQLGRYRAYGPPLKYDMTWRVDFTGGGQSTMNCSWFVWDRNRPEMMGRWCLLQRDGVVTPGTDLFTLGATL